MTPRALTIAGTDPTGGAGVAQDLRTFAALRVWGMAAITAVTVQDTTGVQGWQAVEPDLVGAQIAACARDLGVDAAKTGMLPTAKTIEAVARAAADHGFERLVVDPVLVATSGDALAEDDVVAAFRDALLPRALLVTPNAREAAALCGGEVSSSADQAEAARALVAMGARAALVTGGDLEGGDVVDVLADAEGTQRLVAPRAGGGPFHGTGCLLSAAITAVLARGASLHDAVVEAERLVAASLARALALGAGAKVLDPTAVTASQDV